MVVINQQIGGLVLILFFRRIIRILRHDKFNGRIPFLQSFADDCFVFVVHVYGTFVPSITFIGLPFGSE